MASKFERFKELHQQAIPLLIGNVWNVQSAAIYEKLNYEAIGTSSAAISHSLGYEDGENMPFAEYLYVVKRILKKTTLPLTVDLEFGYGDDIETIYQNINELYKLGVVGINLEDSKVANGVRQLQDRFTFLDKIEGLVELLKRKGVNIFMNVRCDAFLMGIPDALRETIARVKLYESKLVDGIFVPGVTAENDIISFVQSTSLPVNVMCMPELPDFKTLKTLGIKRISMGNFVNDYIYERMKTVSATFVENHNFSALF